MPQTIALTHPPRIQSWANIGGKWEGQGPLRAYFDEISQDSFFGQKTWEQAESFMQRTVLDRALQRAGLTAKNLDTVFAGDLLNQCTASSFALCNSGIPFFGLYGACSTMGESLALAAATLSGGIFSCVAALTSSHFCTAERQYRMPLPYGSQRTPTAQWTATAAGCTILSAQGSGPAITHITCGTVVDLGVRDPANMGAAMAPAASQTLLALFRDTHTNPEDYDLIVTGDLGATGSTLLQELLRREGIDLGSRHTDCGLLLYDRDKQDMHAGGSGCGCSAGVFNGYLLQGLSEGRWQRIIFAPTGALLSPTTSFQGQSIPGICHAICLCAPDVI